MALWIRVTNLYGAAYFIDEGIHLDWAHRFAINAPEYPIFMDGKPLLVVLLYFFRSEGPEPLWVGRAAVGLLSVITCASCLALGTVLSSKRTGLLAALIYAFLPQAVFFERQVIADPIMAIFGTLSILFSLRLVKKQNAVGIIALAFAFAGAVVGKLFGLMYYCVPFFALIFLPTRKKVSRLKLGFSYVAAATLSAALIALFFFALGNRIGVDNKQLASGQVGLLSCPPIICKGDIALEFLYLFKAFDSLFNLIPPYIGWTIVVLAIIAAPLSDERSRRSIIFFATCSFVMLTIFIFISQDIPPRYISFIAAQIVILAAHGWMMIANRLKPLMKQWTLFFVVVIPTLLITLQPVANVIALTRNLEKASLARLDMGYISDDNGGTGVREGALAILQIEKSSKLPPVVIANNILFVHVAAQFDRTQINVRSGGEVSIGDIARWLMTGQHIYIMEQIGEGVSPPILISGLITEEVGRYRRMMGMREVRVMRIVDTTPKVREDFFRTLFLQPDKLSANYQDLIKTLPKDTVVILYPPQQRNMFMDRANVFVVGDSWTLDKLDESLKTIVANKKEVRMVFLDEAKGDPSKRIETWLNTNLFKLDEQWFGAVRMISYAGDDPVKQPNKVGVRFGDGIRLEAVEVIDPVARRGEVVRLRLIWKAEKPITADYKSFTHIFISDKIIAQRDGQPVGELRPTTTWQVGETITDQFAIRIPIDASSGLYQLRIGLYERITQKRLMVNEEEFIVIGEIAIQ